MIPGMSVRRRIRDWLTSLARDSGCRLTTEDGQEDVDEEVSAAATLKENTERRKHDGADDLDDVAVGAG